LWLLWTLFFGACAWFAKAFFSDSYSYKQQDNATKSEREFEFDKTFFKKISSFIDKDLRGISPPDPEKNRKYRAGSPISRETL
jgi:hypothetical protein